MSGRKRWTHLDQMVGEGRIGKDANCESAQLAVDGNSATGTKKTSCANRKAQCEQWLLCS